MGTGTAAMAGNPRHPLPWRAWRHISPTCGSRSPTSRSRRARAAGSPRPTASSTSTSPRGSRSRPRATAIRRCRPRSQEQARRFIHAQVNCYRHDLLEPLADRLAEITPASIETFFYANSGAEITEAAVKLAKQATGRPHVIVFSGSFHGRTHLTMAMTTSKTGYRGGLRAAAGRASSSRRSPIRSRDDDDAEIDRALAGLRPPARRRRPRRPRPRRSSSSPCSAKAATSRHPRVPAGPRGPVRAARHPVRRRRGADRVRAHRARCSR